MAGAASVSIPDCPLAAAPEPSSVFSDDQWVTLFAIAETVIPSIRPPSILGTNVGAGERYLDAKQYDEMVESLAKVAKGNSSDRKNLAREYLLERPTALPAFKEGICRTVGQHVPNDSRQGIRSILTALNNRTFSWLLTGSSIPFHLQPLHRREAIFSSWRTSRLSQMRAFSRGIGALCQKSWVYTSPALTAILDFPRVPTEYKTPSASSFNFNFIQFTPGSVAETISADVVVVGSGCGAGVVAKNLSDAGHSVIVVEKSYHFSEEYFPMTQQEGTTHLFANGGSQSSDDGSISVISGSTWGGGGTINWSASLQTQSYVREEWAKQGELPFFTSPQFQRSLDRVCKYMGVSTDFIEHNHGNHNLLEGARKLGYAAKPVPQNTGKQKHSCGYCTLGCSASIKQGPAVSYLADAARAGAMFIEGLAADKVVFEDNKTSGNKTALGIVGTWNSRDENGATVGKPRISRKVVINAKKVVISCGTLESPLILLRSGLRNPQIGRNLHLHPVMLVGAVYDEESRPWEGSILTSVINQFEDLDGNGHGAKVEAVVMLPALILPLFYASNGLEYKMLVSRLRNMNGFISLVRDRDTGRVYPDPVDGRCRIQYTPSAFDRKSMLEGVIAGAKVAYLSGAKEIHTASWAVPPFIRSAPVPSTNKNTTENISLEDDGVNDPQFQEWIRTLRSGVPFPPDQSMFASAHQMGTCRMGKSPRNSVVDPTGKVWGTDGLYVADASVFPSASGVNPMVTNMAISDWISQNIAKELDAEHHYKISPRL